LKQADIIFQNVKHFLQKSEIEKESQEQQPAGEK
jgi:hypothetical protein